MGKRTKCPKCGHEFVTQCNDKEESLKILLDENKHFLAQALSRGTEDWDDEATKELDKILGIMRRINDLYK